MEWDKHERGVLSRLDSKKVSRDVRPRNCAGAWKKRSYVECKLNNVDCEKLR